MNNKPPTPNHPTPQPLQSLPPTARGSSPANARVSQLLQTVQISSHTFERGWGWGVTIRWQSRNTGRGRQVRRLRVDSLGFWVLCFGFWVLGFGFWVLDFGFWVWSSVFGVRCLGCWEIYLVTMGAPRVRLGTKWPEQEFGVWGLGFGVWGLGFGVWGLGFVFWVCTVHNVNMKPISSC